jgi:ligand-binding sensor domain-containing protein
MQKIFASTLLIFLISFNVNQLSGEWSNYTNPKIVEDLIRIDDTLWAATGGGLLKWNLQTHEYELITSAQGLLANPCQSIAQTPDGTICLGTSHGLSLYKNGSWINYTLTDGLLDDLVKKIIVAPDGKIWFCSYEGVSYLENGSFQHFTTATGLIHANANSMASDSSGVIWVATISGISRIENDVITNFSVAGPDNINYFLDNMVDREQNVWFGAYAGVVKFDGTNWTLFTEIADLPSVFTNTLAQAADGKIWIGAGSNDLTKGGGAAFFDGTQWTRVMDPDSLLAHRILKVLGDSENNIWFATYEGVVKYDGANWEYFLAPALFPSNRLTDCQFQEENLWVASSQGLIKFVEGATELFTTANGLVSNDLVTLAIAPDNHIWVGSGSGLNEFDGSTWLTYQEAQGIKSQRVRDIVFDRNKNLWAATAKGVSTYNGANWTNFTPMDGLPSEIMYCLGVDSSGNIWAGTKFSGTARYDFNSWTKFSTKDGMVSNNPRVMYTDPTGTLWIGNYEGSTYTGGLCKLTENGWVNYTTADGMLSNNILSLFMDSQKKLWIGSDCGVDIFDGETFQPVTCLDGLGSNFVNRIAEDGNGNMWFVCNYGGLSCWVGKNSGVAAPISSEKIDTPELLPNYPNPFSPENGRGKTQIRYRLPDGARQTRVQISIYNLLGQEIFRCQDETQSGGQYLTDWRGVDFHGHLVSAGIYFVQLRVENFVATSKLLLLD